MPSIFTNNWVNQTQNKIDFWFNLHPLSPKIFSITSLPMLEE